MFARSLSPHCQIALSSTLQLEGIVSFKTALERAMGIKIIQENFFKNKEKNLN